MLPLPRPTLNVSPFLQNLKVLLFSDSINNLTKRVRLELLQRKVNVHVVEATSPVVMEYAASKFKPDVIICPFLTKRIPESITSLTNRPCLIVHPGIAGDRGPSSLDWAIRDDLKEWGVTILQAEREMDAGDIWCTDNFPLDIDATKAGVYVGDVSDSAVKGVFESLTRFVNKVPPVPLSYDHGEVKGCLKRPIKLKDRKINWDESAQECSAKIRMSDTQPGAMATLSKSFMRPSSEKVRMRAFDACIEHGSQSRELLKLIKQHSPGEIIGRKYGAILVKCGDEKAVWIGQLKQETIGGNSNGIKLPSSYVMKRENIQKISFDTDHDDVRVSIQGEVAYVHFDFYNGAMDRFQASRLERTLQLISTNDSIKVVALMGGERFFSTGIHLNIIHSNENIYNEAWLNINKIDDVILAMSRMTSKATVAVLQGNAGAGGAMMAAAADIVLAHPGVLLTPSYKAMSLYGSEYWTHFLPHRVGDNCAQSLIQDTEPILASTANHIGLVDFVIGKGKRDFQNNVPDFILGLVESGHIDKVIEEKRKIRNDEWFSKLNIHRQHELRRMSEDFRSKAFLDSMTRFVYKLKEDDDVSMFQCSNRAHI